MLEAHAQQLASLNADPAMFARNLAVVRGRSAVTADRIEAAAGREGIEVAIAPDGWPTGSVPHGGVLRRLASARRPGDEARALVADIDLAAAGVVVIFGFGVGNHVRSMSERMKRSGLIVVFEPDVSLLRSVFERIDCSGWLKDSNVVVLTDECETGEIAAVTKGFEAAVACGLKLLDHPPSRPLLGERAAVFAERFTHVVKAVRTAVVTTLVHVDVSLRNVLQNIEHYVRWPGLNDLAGVAQGRSAIVVSAGPSLQRNLHLLEDPEVRKHFVIIATQTMLKPLLARGIKPHFVTALDYHEISRRFYEGLTPADVEGVTLVVEPKANPAILDAFPGAIRCVADRVLDEILGAELYEPRTDLPPGATVAHLAYYLARHLGADPVIMIGQDLGFTDHCYYGPGAAIHRVWGPELGAFRTIEMLEWERIARMKGLLRRIEDYAGRPMFTDEQMATYLVQFERDFLADTQRGLRVIDATEGGCAKRHAQPMPLAQVLAEHRSTCRVHLPAAVSKPNADENIKKARARLNELLTGSGEMERLSRETSELLEEVRTHQSDQPRVNRVLANVHKNASKVAGLGAAHWLVQYISQTSQLKRFKSDRAIEIDAAGLSPLERQSRELERDISNVRWLSDGAAKVQSLLKSAVASLDGAPKPTREETDVEEGAGRLASAIIGAVIVFDPDRTGLNTVRPEGADARLVLNTVLDAVGRVEALNGVVVLLSPDSPLASEAMWPSNVERCVMSEVEWTSWRRHRATIGAARAFQARSWRGAVGNTTIFDEAVCASVAATHAKQRGWDAVLAVGCDWEGFDPELNSALLGRYREGAAPAVIFSQAPPGVAGAVIPTTLLADLSSSTSRLATLGGVLGYLPAAPQADPIVKAACVQVNPQVRDAYVRRIGAERGECGGTLPRMLEIAGFEMGLSDHQWMTALTTLVQERPDIAVTFDVRALSPQVAVGAARRFLHLSRVAGVSALHVRLSASALREGLDDLLPEVLSVDFGSSPQDADQECLLKLVHARVGTTGWIVPRMSKGADNLERMEGWYDFWIQAAGCAVIDPPIEGDRLGAFPWPQSAQDARNRETWFVNASGRVRSGEGTVGDLAREAMISIIDRVRGIETERLQVSEIAHV